MNRNASEDTNHIIGETREGYASEDTNLFINPH